jgi:hypothetical protein
MARVAVMKCLSLGAGSINHHCSRCNGRRSRPSCGRARITRGIGARAFPAHRPGGARAADKRAAARAASGSRRACFGARRQPGGGHGRKTPGRIAQEARFLDACGHRARQGRCGRCLRQCRQYRCAHGHRAFRAQDHRRHRSPGNDLADSFAILTCWIWAPTPSAPASTCSNSQ